MGNGEYKQGSGHEVVLGKARVTHQVPGWHTWTLSSWLSVQGSLTNHGVLGRVWGLCEVGVQTLGIVYLEHLKILNCILIFLTKRPYTGN